MKEGTSLGSLVPVILTLPSPEFLKPVPKRGGCPPADDGKNPFTPRSNQNTRGLGFNEGLKIDVDKKYKPPLPFDMN